MISWGFYVIKVYLDKDWYLVFVVKAFYHSKLKPWFKYMHPFSRMYTKYVD